MPAVTPCPPAMSWAGLGPVDIRRGQVISLIQVTVLRGQHVVRTVTGHHLIGPAPAPQQTTTCGCTSYDLRYDPATNTFGFVQVM